MRRTLLILLLACAPAALGAQAGTGAGRQQLPPDVRREVVARWNGIGPTGVRASDRLEIAADRNIAGDVAALRGPVIVSGHVGGGVLAVNADVTLMPTAQIDGDLLVVGGEMDRREGSRVNGAIRIYRQPLALRQDGDRIVALDDQSAGEESWWRRFERRDDDRSAALRIVKAGAYNRVEGLPIQLGPVVRRRTPWGSVQLDAAAVLRTATSFSSDRSDVGQTLRAEVRIGRERGVGVGAAAYNVVDAVESWQLSDLETALAAVISRRDYRDYYGRHGAQGFVTLFGDHDMSLMASYGTERWSSRAARNPFSIFSGERAWRDNPLMDEGLFHVADLRASVDTRTDPEDPWSGWFASASVEYGTGHPTSLAPTTSPRAATGDAVSYSRAFLDLRRYNRLGPDAQLNMRVVLGGWLDGDALPLERRLSVDGPGALPGFDFRSGRAGADVATCNEAPLLPSRPAECDRIALAQAEYRGDLRWDLFGNWDDWPHRYHGEHGDAAWVLFADAGRGWKVGAPGGGLTYRRGEIPPLGTFRADLGVGLDVSGIGIYAAKSVSTPAEPINYFVRLHHRF